MKLIDTTCPHCGAALKVNMERGFCFCEYCGTKLLIDDEAQHIRYDNAEQAGYEFEKGRQRAQEEYYAQAQTYPQTVYVEQPKKRKTFLWVLGWIFIFPLPLTLIIAKNKTLPVWAKALIIAAGWIVYIALAVRSGAS